MNKIELIPAANTEQSPKSSESVFSTFSNPQLIRLQKQSQQQRQDRAKTILPSNTIPLQAQKTN